MSLAVTIISSFVLFLFIFVIIIERRTRDIVHNRHYLTHTIIPATKLTLESKRYVLFNIPERIGNGRGCLYFQCTGSLRQYSTVLCTLHCDTDDAYKVFEFNHNDRFVVDTCIPFTLRDTNRNISIKLETYNPNLHNLMSDLVVTLVLDTLSPVMD